MNYLSMISYELGCSCQMNCFRSGIADELVRSTKSKGDELFQRVYQNRKNWLKLYFELRMSKQKKQWIKWLLILNSFQNSKGISTDDQKLRWGLPSQVPYLNNQEEAMLNVPPEKYYFQRCFFSSYRCRQYIQNKWNIKLFRRRGRGQPQVYLFQIVLFQTTILVR